MRSNVTLEAGNPEDFELLGDKKALSDYIGTKSVKYDEVKSRFTMVRRYEKEYCKGEEMCLNCDDKLNQRWYIAEPYVSCQYCWKCNSINLVIRPDCMGGYCMDNVEVYK
jgi:hypothetical protein